VGLIVGPLIAKRMHQGAGAPPGEAEEKEDFKKILETKVLPLIPKYSDLQKSQQSKK
jgi:hypothetical protein